MRFKKIIAFTVLAASISGVTFNTTAHAQEITNKDVSSVVEDNIITGRLDIIRDDFNEVVGKNYFTALSRYFNLLYYAASDEEIKGLTDWILMTGRVYNLRSKGLLNFKK